MLAILMYHRIGSGKHTNSLSLLKEHLELLKNRFPIVLPGENVDKLSVLLTFDDASYDFYHYVFPLLKELGLRALLGVPTHYIVEKTSLPPEIRLSVPYTMLMQEEIAREKVPFCTWEELSTMVKSGLVEVASHSHLHPNLTFPFVDLEREVVLSKKILEERLPQAVTSFIYPFGKSDERVETFVSKHYRYTYRIGSALNFGWGKGSIPLARIPADHLKDPRDPLTYKNMLQYFLKAILRLE